METKPDISWLEVLADNFLGAGGMPAYQLATLAERYALTLHSVGLSIGGTEPLDYNYLALLKALKKRSGAMWLSDHLCFTHAQGLYSHDLLPIPYTEESLKHVIKRLNRVQDYLGEAILIENPSSYLDAGTNELSEAAFLSHLVTETNCKLLLDVNNIYLSQYNRQQRCDDYLSHIPWHSVAEIHLAGFAEQIFGEGQSFLIDAHNNPVSEPVWLLFEQVLQVLPNVPALIEWDNQLPPLEELIKEQQKAELIRQKVLSSKEKLSAQSPLTHVLKTSKQDSEKNTRDLKHWQQQFIAAVYKDHKASKKITALFANQETIRNQAALSIYQNNCQKTLISALEQCYKVCRQLIGRRAFRQQAARYVGLHASRAQDLNQYGHDFPSYLSTLIKNESAYSAVPYLADMALYEHHLQAIYYAPGAPANALPTAPGVKLYLLSVGLNKHCRIFTSPYPISALWRIHDEKSLEQLPLLGEKKREHCIIYRHHDLGIVSAKLEPLHFWLFQQLTDKPIPLAKFVALAETSKIEINTLLPDWVNAGWLSINEHLQAGNTVRVISSKAEI